MKHTTLTNINTFTSEEFGEIRTVTIDGEPWFVAKDISDKLGYAQTSNMMKRIDDEDFKSSILDGMNMKSILINESGVYSAILGSKLESAKRFKYWVTAVVLPSIRKNGGYVMEETNLSDNELLAKAVLLSQNIIEEKNKKIQELNTDIDYKKDVIQNFADNVPLLDQRRSL